MYVSHSNIVKKLLDFVCSSNLAKLSSCFTPISALDLWRFNGGLCIFVMLTRGI